MKLLTKLAQVAAEVVLPILSSLFWYLMSIMCSARLAFSWRAMTSHVWSGKKVRWKIIHGGQSALDKLDEWREVLSLSRDALVYRRNSISSLPFILQRIDPSLGRFAVPSGKLLVLWYPLETWRYAKAAAHTTRNIENKRSAGRRLDCHEIMFTQSILGPKFNKRNRGSRSTR